MSCQSGGAPTKANMTGRWQKNVVHPAGLPRRVNRVNGHRRRAAVELVPIRPNNLPPGSFSPHRHLSLPCLPVTWTAPAWQDAEQRACESQHKCGLIFCPRPGPALFKRSAQHPRLPQGSSLLQAYWFCYFMQARENTVEVSEINKGQKEQHIKTAGEKRGCAAPMKEGSPPWNPITAIQLGCTVNINRFINNSCWREQKWLNLEAFPRIN